MYTEIIGSLLIHPRRSLVSFLEILRLQAFLPMFDYRTVYPTTVKSECSLFICSMISKDESREMLEFLILDE